MHIGFGELAERLKRLKQRQANAEKRENTSSKRKSASEWGEISNVHQRNHHSLSLRAFI